MINNMYSQLFIISAMSRSFSSITDTNIESIEVVIVEVKYSDIFQFMSLKNLSLCSCFRLLYFAFLGLFFAMINVKLSATP